MRAIRGILACALLAAAAMPLAAQENTGVWVVDLRGGALLYDEASAIETGAVLGLEALYRFGRNFAVGPSIDYAQTQTAGEFFIGVLDFGADSTRIYEVSQPLSALHYGLNAVFDVLPDSRFGPYVGAGGGGYRLYLDSQSNEAPTTVNGAMLQAGGGIRWSISDAAGVQLDVRDLIYLDFDREELNPIDPRHRNRRDDGTIRFPAAEEDLPDASSTIHNFRLTLGFTYVPGLGR